MEEGKEEQKEEEEEEEDTLQKAFNRCLSEHSLRGSLQPQENPEFLA